MKCAPSSVGRACICTFAASEPASCSVNANAPSCSPVTNFGSHLGKAPSAVFHWRSRTEHADAPKTIDDLARNICLSIYLRRIELIEKLPQFSQRLVQLRLLRCRDAWIRHHPIGNEMTLEKTLGKTQRLWPG